VDDLGRLNPKRDVFAYRITNPATDSAAPKHKVVVTTGLHAGGVLGTHTFEGLINWLVSEDARAVRLRDDADFDEDGDVDQADLATWQNGYGITVATDHHQGDADGDQNVNGKDFLIWQRQFTDNLSNLSLLTSVPEPSTGILVIGLLSMISGSRFRLCPDSMQRSWLGRVLPGQET
jgi:hypothetical protein